MTRARAANRASLGIAGALLALELLLYLQPPRWDSIERWQLDGQFKTVTGYLLLAMMLAMWLPIWLRRRFSEPAQLFLIRLVHQWIGVVALLVFMLHANLARSGHLAILTLLLLATSGLGTGLAWMQDTGRAVGRRWLMAAHIAVGFAVSSFSVLHLYFVYAYTG